MDIKAIEKRIGYTFRDKSILERAFTHNSYDVDTVKNYQSIEFLGDSIVNFVAAKRLLEIYPKRSAGELTNMRKAVVSSLPLAEATTALDIADYMRVGKSETLSKITSHDKIKEDLFEALTAAIYLDSQSMDVAEHFVLASLENDILALAQYDVSNATDFKSILNEYASKHSLSSPVYTVESTEGESNDLTYFCAVAIDGKKLGVGSGSRKKVAEQIAAEQACKSFNI